MGGLKGAVGEVGKGAAVGDGATGLAGTRAGNLNWRSGGASGSREGGAAADPRTRNVKQASSDEQQWAMGLAEKKAASGESWVRFFLHPDSDFFRDMSGSLATHPLRAANLPAIARAHRERGMASAAPVPSYARGPDGFDGIMAHIGVGGFHRSHQAVYTHRLLMDQVGHFDTHTERIPLPPSASSVFFYGAKSHSGV